MEGLIQQAFMHVDMIGKEVHEGHFDLLGPDGEIILPQVWETTVQPDWMITMHMWPKPEPAKPKAGAGIPGPGHHPLGGGAHIAEALQNLAMGGARKPSRHATGLGSKKPKMPGFGLPRIPGLPVGIPPPPLPPGGAPGALPAGIPPPPPPPLGGGGGSAIAAAFAAANAAAVPVKERKSSSGKKKSSSGSSSSGRKGLLMFAAGAGRSGSKSRRER